MGKYNDFQKELTDLINKHSMENVSNTPDYVLAAYLVRCLEDFEWAIKSRSLSKRGKDHA